MGLTLLDSSVLIAWLYRDDAHHEAAVGAVEAEIEDRRHLALSVIAWTEVLAGTGSRGRGRDAAETLVRDARIRMLDVGRAVAEAAAPLRARFATPDALILATASCDPDVTRVLTADARWATAGIDGVAISILGR